MKVSAIVLVKSEVHLISDCLDSLGWTDEVIVVENGSTDKTLEIAKKKGAKIVSSPKGNFSERRNLGARAASSDWLLYIDVDERVTPELHKEILSTITHHPLSIGYFAYAIPRRNILLGHKMHWGGWWPDYVLRLIKKDALITWKGELHEQPQVKGEVGKLNSPLLHYSHRSLAEMVDKTNAWSEIEAKLLFADKHPKMAWWRFIAVAFRELWYRGVLKLGFLDGTVGVIEIIYQMYSRMITYAKLWEMQIGKSEARNPKS